MQAQSPILYIIVIPKQNITVRPILIKYSDNVSTSLFTSTNLLEYDFHSQTILKIYHILLVLQKT